MRSDRIVVFMDASLTKLSFPWRENIAEILLPAPVPVRSLRSEFVFDEPVQVLAYRRMVEALHDFVQKTGDEETLGDFCRDAARAQIKQLIFFNLPRRCAVSATDII